MQACDGGDGLLARVVGAGERVSLDFLRIVQARQHITAAGRRGPRDIAVVVRRLGKNLSGRAADRQAGVHYVYAGREGNLARILVDENGFVPGAAVGAHLEMEIIIAGGADLRATGVVRLEEEGGGVGIVGLVDLELMAGAGMIE